MAIPRERRHPFRPTTPSTMASVIRVPQPAMPDAIHDQGRELGLTMSASRRAGQAQRLGRGTDCLVIPSWTISGGYSPSHHDVRDILTEMRSHPLGMKGPLVRHAAPMGQPNDHLTDCIAEHALARGVVYELDIDDWDKSWHFSIHKPIIEQVKIPVKIFRSLVVCVCRVGQPENIIIFVSNRQVPRLPSRNESWQELSSTDSDHRSPL